MFSLRKISISLLFVGLTYFTFASIGGGKHKSSNSRKAAFTPIKTSKGFSVRSGLNYRGTVILNEERTPGRISYNSLVTYQKGNATYILPNKYNVSLAHHATRSNLQMLNVKIKLCK